MDNLNRLREALPGKAGAQARVSPEHAPKPELQCLDVHTALEREGRLGRVNILPLFEQGVKEHALLQRGKRVDVFDGVRHCWPLPCNLPMSWFSSFLLTLAFGKSLVS